MDTTQVVQALVDPDNGVIVRMVNKLGNLEKNQGEAVEVLKAHGAAIRQADDRIDGLANEQAHIATTVLADVDARIKELENKLAALEAKLEEAPKKRSRKKAEPVPAPEETPAEEPAEQVDPTAPAYEPGLVPDVIEGVEITGKVALSVRNNIRVLSLSLAKTLDPQYPGAVYDFVAGLTDDEVNAIAEKFPG